MATVTVVAVVVVVGIAKKGNEFDNTEKETRKMVWKYYKERSESAEILKKQKTNFKQTFIVIMTYSISFIVIMTRLNYSIGNICKTFCFFI